MNAIYIMQLFDSFITLYLLFVYCSNYFNIISLVLHTKTLACLCKSGHLLFGWLEKKKKHLSVTQQF